MKARRGLYKDCVQEFLDSSKQGILVNDYWPELFKDKQLHSVEIGFKRATEGTDCWLVVDGSWLFLVK